MKPITDHPFTQDLLTSNKWFWNCRTPQELASLPIDDGQFEALLSIVQNNKKLFSLICTTIPTMDGWCSVEKACALASLTLAMRPISVVEIGVWGGRSLLPMAFAMQHIGSGMITGIDPYSPQESANGQFSADEKWWSQQDHKAIRDKFLQFVKMFKIEGHVRLVEQPSGKVDTSNMKVQILHSDGNHGESALHDAEKYGPTVQLGGLVICDDIGWTGGSVLRSIDEYESQGFVEVLRREGNGENWNIMQKVK